MSRVDPVRASNDRLQLLRWYISRINLLLYEITDAANFTDKTDPQAPMGPIFGFEHMLTVDRLMRKTLAAMSLDDAPVANLSVFEIADLYDTLRESLAGTGGGTRFFRALFNTQEGPALIVPRLASMPAPFGDYWSALARHVYRRIEETVIASVWRPEKITPDGVLVRNNEKMTTETVMTVPAFVSEVTRAYRNAHHGYFSAGQASRNRPSRFLFMVDGNLPVEMSALPVLWWLAYLAGSSMVGHLDINASRAQIAV